MGFTMNPTQAIEMIERDARNADVLYPYLGGEDLNSRPDVSASRWIVNFGEIDQSMARAWCEPWQWIERHVKPERMKKDAAKYPRMVHEWWKYFNPRPAMMKAISELQRVLVLTRHSKTVMPVMVPTGQVFSDATVVFCTDDTAILALLSSAPHYWWAVSRASSMKTDLRYTPSDVFETFPLPELTSRMRELGDRLDTYRRNVMLSRQAGLTKTYNLVHDPACTDADIGELRAIHRGIDEATVGAYGWDDLLDGLDHGFHPVGREIRYTIGLAAQREILDRLLELNHARYAEEVAAGLHDKGKKRRGKAADGGGGLF